MKALSVIPEATTLIFQGEKTVECRSWKTNYRGEVLICPTKVPVPGCISGHAYFTAMLTDIVPFTEEHLEAAMMEGMPDVSCYAWYLEDITPIYPIPVRGKPGLFDVDDSLIRYATDGLDENMPEAEAVKFFEEFDAKYLAPLTYIPDQL